MIGDAVSPGVERTGRWRGLGAATLLAAALGLIGRQPALVLVAAVGVALLAYARLVAPPPLELSIRRSTERPPGAGARDTEGDRAPAPDGSGSPDGEAIEPGDRIAVTLTVENAGDRTIPDLRLVDGVPPGLSVVEGTPRIGTTLRPGETATCRYEIETRAGRHAFEPVAAIARDVAGVVERRDRIPVADDEIEAESGSDLHAGPPLRAPAVRFVGTDDADETGEGVAFEGIRAYRHGDPPGRIDWRRLARTGELTTVTYREEQGHAVVLVVDARPAAAVAPSPADPTAIERSLRAASAFADRLAAEGHRVGIARLGPEPRWIAPGGGPRHRRRVRELLAERPPEVLGDLDQVADDDGGATASEDEAATTSEDEATTAGAGEAATASDENGEPTGDPATADGAESAPYREWLRERLPPRTEVLFLSPCTDEAAIELARYVDATGSPVTVLSPDSTDDATPGRRLARVERRHRLRSLRAAGVPVLDWPAEASLDAAIRTGTRQEPEVQR